MLNHHDRTQILGEVLNQPVLEPGEDLLVRIQVRVETIPSPKFFQVLIQNQALAENAVGLVQKGDHIFASGPLSLETLNRRPALVLYADEIVFLGRRQLTPVRQQLTPRS